MPVSLTVGDASTCYQTFRKERHEVGLNKGMTINKCRGTTATEGFGKFESNALGDPYVDPGKFNGSLRKPRSNSVSTNHMTPFSTTSNKKVRKSEFEYIPLGPADRPTPETAPRFATRVKADPFTSLNKLGYSEDPYERRQDLGRDEYAKQNSKILHRDAPWNNRVRQRGTFYPNFTTYGTNIAFSEKKPEIKKQPLFGPFKKGDMLKTGYNKCLGGHGRTTEDQYMEEMEQDTVKYRKNVTTNFWRGVTNGQSMGQTTTLNNFRNVNKERNNIF